MPHESDTYPESATILFAGGCHIIGYPIGEDRSFPAIIRMRLRQEGAKVEVGTLPYLKLPHRRRLTAKCKELRPDVLVLQLGHAELNQQLTKYIQRLWGLSNRRSESEIPAKSVRSPLGFYIKGCVKRLIDGCLGHPLADFAQIETLWRSLFKDIQNLHIPAVVVLSPLPCADLTAMFYRRRVLPLFRRLASEYGCEFIDLLTESPQKCPKRFDVDEYYYDGIHLAASGQLAVAQAVMIRLSAVLRSLRKCHS